MASDSPIKKVEPLYLRALRATAVDESRLSLVVADYKTFPVSDPYSGQSSAYDTDIYDQYFTEMADHYRPFHDTIIKNKKAKSFITKSVNNSGTYYYVKLDFLDIYPPPLDVSIPKIKVGNAPQLLTEFDFVAFLYVSTSLLSEAAKALDFYLLESDDPTEEPLALMAGAPCEILVKGINDQISHNETHLIYVFNTTLSAIRALLPQIKDIIDTQKELADAKNAAIGEDDENTGRRLTVLANSFEWSELEKKFKDKKINLRDKLKKMINAIYEAYPIYGRALGKTEDIMTRDTEYSVSEYYLTNTKQSPSFLRLTRFLPTVTYIIPHIISTNDQPFLASRSQLESLLRASCVESLFYGTLRILTRLLDVVFFDTDMFFLLPPYKAAELTRVTISDAHKSGVSTARIKEIVEHELLQAKKVVDISERKTSESNALRKFLQKIGMPIDISGTGIKSAERAVAARLRKLGKELSEKYGVAYDSSPGTVVLSAMRRADDIDEIMVSISAALEDCFSIIDSAPSE